MNDNKFIKLIGKWKHISPYDGDDYLAIYEVSGTVDTPKVTGYDTSDNEKFIISNVAWDGKTLTFESLMPSTKRKGINKFTLKGDGEIQSEFTFTIYDQLIKENT